MLPLVVVLAIEIDWRLALSLSEGEKERVPERLAKMTVVEREGLLEDAVLKVKGTEKVGEGLSEVDTKEERKTVAAVTEKPAAIMLWYTSATDMPSDNSCAQ